MVVWQFVAMLVFVATAVVMGIVAAVMTLVHRRRAAQRHREQSGPLATLELQLRLGQIAREIRLLSDGDAGPDGLRYANAHHTRAAQLAYDSLLREACRRAGLPDDPIATDQDRLLRELELSSRGWSW